MSWFAISRKTKLNSELSVCPYSLQWCDIIKCSPVSAAWSISFFLLWNWQVGESVTNETLAQRRMRCSLQAKVLVAQLRRILCHPMYCSPPWNSPGENTGVGSHSLLQGILPTLELNLGLLYCLQILYHLSHHYFE